MLGEQKYYLIPKERLANLIQNHKGGQFGYGFRSNREPDGTIVVSNGAGKITLTEYQFREQVVQVQDSEAVRGRMGTFADISPNNVNVALEWQDMMRKIAGEYEY